MTQKDKSKCPECNLRRARVNYLIEDNAKLRRALSFYADRRSWTLGAGKDLTDPSPIAALADEGVRARVALDEHREEDSESLQKTRLKRNLEAIKRSDSIRNRLKGLRLVNPLEKGKP